MYGTADHFGVVVHCLHKTGWQCQAAMDNITNSSDIVEEGINAPVFAQPVRSALAQWRAAPDQLPQNYYVKQQEAQ